MSIILRRFSRKICVKKVRKNTIINSIYLLKINMLSVNLRNYILNGIFIAFKIYFHVNYILVDRLKKVLRNQLLKN